MRGGASDSGEGQKRRPRRSQDEILHLILSSASAEFQQRGYDGATTAMIAHRAGVTETQLFRYFRSKADLFKKTILDPLNERFEQFNAKRLGTLPITRDWRIGARTYVLELMHFIEAHRDMFMPLIIAQRYAATSVEGVSGVDSLQAYFDISATSMTANLAEGADFDPKLIVRVSFAAVLATVLFRDWLFPDQANGRAEISDALVDFVLDGISAHHVRSDA